MYGHERKVLDQPIHAHSSQKQHFLKSLKQKYCCKLIFKSFVISNVLCIHVTISRGTLKY